MTKIPVILDTDIGGDVDDTWALAQMLRCPELDCKMISIVGGDTQYKGLVVAKFLEIAGRTDIPIVLGDCDLKATDKYQEPWVADYSIDDYSGVVDDNAAEQMSRLLVESEGITVVSIGVTTNVAAVIDRIGDNIKKHKFVGMHGSIYKGHNDKEGPIPESNVRKDIGSFRKVIQAPWKDILLTPLDTCGNVYLSGDNYQKLYRSNDIFAETILENYRIWSKLQPWMTFTEEMLRTRSSFLFDTVAVYLAYSEDWVDIKTINMSVSDEGLTYEDSNGAPVRIAYKWNNKDAFMVQLVERLTNS